MSRNRGIIHLLLTLTCGFLLGCSPKVELSASKEPITINLNVKIDHEVRVKVEKDLDKVLTPESGLF